MTDHGSLEHGGMADQAVLNLDRRAPDAAHLQHVVAAAVIDEVTVVVLKQAGSGNAALTEELAALCKKTLAPYKYPRWVEYVNELPKTATGKIQRFKLRA